MTLDHLQLLTDYGTVHFRYLSVNNHEYITGIYLYVPTYVPNEEKK